MIFFCRYGFAQLHSISSMDGFCPQSAHESRSMISPTGLADIAGVFAISSTGRVRCPQNRQWIINDHPLSAPSGDCRVRGGEIYEASAIRTMADDRAPGQFCVVGDDVAVAPRVERVPLVRRIPLSAALVVLVVEARRVAGVAALVERWPLAPLAVVVPGSCQTGSALICVVRRAIASIADARCQRGGCCSIASRKEVIRIFVPRGVVVEIVFAID
jgi:hypothetical protein